ncbi:hypothetical protein [Geoglobus ahangari]
MLLELYIMLFVTGVLLFVLSFIDRVKHPLYALMSALIFGLLTYMNFAIDKVDIVYNSAAGTAETVKTTLNEPLMAWITAIFAVVGVVQFFYLAWAKTGEVIESGDARATRW